jgi:UDP-N-acetylmuramoyl-L-alanyl-D-glutamate--2,6-diaminopimelate ligase
MKMSLEALLTNIPITALTGNPQSEISGICHDSRRVEEGFLFVAVRGCNADGTLFVRDAIERGAVAVASEESLRLHPECAALRVDDARRFLAEASRVFFHDPPSRLTLVGITGTNGKTTTSYLIDSILSEAGRVSCLVGTLGMKTARMSFSSNLTSPEAPDLMKFLRAALDQGCTHGVLEVSSHALTMKRVYGTKISVGVFSNLTPEHLDFHEDMEDYYLAKRLLFAREGENHPDRAVINVDDRYGRRLVSEVCCPVVRFGIESEADVRLIDRRGLADRIELRILTPQGEMVLETHLIGRANIYNILAAVGTAVSLGIDTRSIQRGIKSMARIPGRLERIDEGQPFGVLVDYAHTPHALEVLLTAAAELPHGKLITVFGCGGGRDRKKRPMMGEIAARLSDFVIVTSDNPRTEDPTRILAEVEPGLTKQGAEYRLVADRREAITLALSMARSGDMIVIAGKGHEEYQIIGNQSFPFDDRAIARELITKLLNSTGARN